MFKYMLFEAAINANSIPQKEEVGFFSQRGQMENKGDACICSKILLACLMRVQERYENEEKSIPFLVDPS